MLTRDEVAEAWTTLQRHSIQLRQLEKELAAIRKEINSLAPLLKRLYDRELYGDTPLPNLKKDGTTNNQGT